MDLIDRSLAAVNRVLDEMCAFLEWYSHSDDLRAASRPTEAPYLMPSFSDDDGDCCDDYDLFFDEYDWESKNDMR